MPSSLFCLWKSTKAVHNSLSFLFQYNYVILQVRHSKFKNLQLHLKQYQKKKKKRFSKSNPSSSLTIYYNSNQISSKSSVSKTTIRYSKSQSSSARNLLSIYFQRPFFNILITSCSENQNHQTETALVRPKL